MIIYNITIKVDWSIADEWLSWMQGSFVPEMLNTGCFDKHLLVRLLQVDETEGPTYAAQFYATTLSKYDHYLQYFAGGFKREIANKWGDKHLDFNTLMQVVD